ncbi:hypothetical protein ACFS4T_03160 [Pseudomonas lini]
MSSRYLSSRARKPSANPTVFDLELVSERPDLELESLLHRQAFLSFDAQGSGIHGQIFFASARAIPANV